MKINNYLISVIIPIYNVQDYIEECLLSVLNQSYKKIEIICVDDGSTDKSPNVIKKYLSFDNRIKSYRKNNEGLSSARNFGIKHSSGDYIVFVDADDFIDKKYVELLLNGVIKNGCDTCMCLVNEFDTTPKIYKSKFKEQIFTSNSIFENYFFHFNNEYNGYFMCAWGKIYRRSFLIKNVFVNKIYEDEYLTPILFDTCKKIIVIPERLYFYRKNRKKSIITTINEGNNKSKYLLDLYYYRYVFFKKKDYSKKIKIYVVTNFINFYIDNISSHTNKFSFFTLIKASFINIFWSFNKSSIKLFLKLLYKRAINL